MEHELKMPDLSTTGDSVRIVEWYVGVGEHIRRGEPIVSVETDKAVMDVEATVTGQLKRILAAEERQVATGEVVAIVEVPERV
jgi:pyruvate dehydrogenase E2 component (dihydrolipoamide acetyltransferase)